MSQNALLDRETVTRTTEAAPVEERMPITRTQREHLTLLDWDRTARADAPNIVAKAYPPVIPARRPWFGWSEAYIGLLLLASGVAAAVSLLHLG